MADESTHLAAALDYGPTSLVLLAASPRQRHVTPHLVRLTPRMYDLAVRYEGLEVVSLVKQPRPAARRVLAVAPTPAKWIGGAWARPRTGQENGCAPAGGPGRTELVSTDGAA